MSSLPLVLEQTARWYFFFAPLAAIVYYMLGRHILQMRRRNWEGMTVSFIPVVALILLGALWTVLLPIGWELRLDREGVTLRAPLSFWEDSGTIAWRDLRDVRLGSTMSTRSGSFPTVEFVGRDGRVFELKALNAVPPAYWPAFVAAIDANAQSVSLEPDSAEWLKRVQSAARSDSPDRALVGYVAHDGQGRRLE